MQLNKNKKNAQLKSRALNSNTPRFPCCQAQRGRNLITLSIRAISCGNYFTSSIRAIACGNSVYYESVKAGRLWMHVNREV